MEVHVFRQELRVESFDQLIATDIRSNMGRYRRYGIVPYYRYSMGMRTDAHTVHNQKWKPRSYGN